MFINSNRSTHRLVNNNFSNLYTIALQGFRKIVKPLLATEKNNLFNINMLQDFFCKPACVFSRAGNGGLIKGFEQGFFCCATGAKNFPGWRNIRKLTFYNFHRMYAGKYSNYFLRCKQFYFISYFSRNIRNILNKGMDAILISCKPAFSTRSWFKFRVDNISMLFDAITD